MDKKFEIVSLGTNCMVRNILTRYGIKPSKAQGELTCPFDLVNHPIEVIVESLENSFSTYFEGFYYHVAPPRNIFDFTRKDSRWRKADGTIFAHDEDCKASDYEKLESRIQNRIKNFKDILSSKHPILFVINIQNAESRKYINRLHDALRLIFGGGYFLLAVIDFNGVCEEPFYPEIKVLNLPLPCEDYHKIWFKKSFYLRTKLGAYTEKCVAEFVQNIIDTEF